MKREYRQHHVTVYVPRDLLDQVDVYCHEQGLNRSQFTRNAWANMYGNHPNIANCDLIEAHIPMDLICGQCGTIYKQANGNTDELCKPCYDKEWEEWKRMNIEGYHRNGD
jgi:hypothetical protein